MSQLVRTVALAVAYLVLAPMLYAGLAAAFAEGVDRLVENRNVTVAARGIDDSSVACKGVPGLFVTTAEQFLDDHGIQDEVFGPASVIVRVANVDQLDATPADFGGRPACRDHVADRAEQRVCFAHLHSGIDLLITKGAA